MRVSIAVLDDNRAFLEGFSKQLQGQCEVLGLKAQIQSFDEAEAFYGYLREKRGVDIAFVDIILPGESGIAFAARLQQEFPQLKLLFITAVLENAVNIFDARPSYFLVKPITEERLCKALNTVLQELRTEESEAIVLKSKGSAYRLRKSDIFYIESNGRQLEIHLPGSVISVYGGMKEMEALLDDRMFRCHRSYLVNLSQVCQVCKQEYTLYSGQRIPISRERLSQARTLFFHSLRAEKKGGPI